MTLITWITAYFALIFLLAGVVKGVVGLGLPTVAMGLLSLRMPPAEAAALLLLPSFSPMYGSSPRARISASSFDACGRHCLRSSSARAPRLASSRRPSRS